jgi:hypothetical protein
MGGKRAWRTLRFRDGDPKNYSANMEGCYGSRNSVAHATLEVRIFQRQFGAFGEPQGDGRILDELTFNPTFRSNEVVWIGSDGEHIFPTNQLAGHLVEAFVTCIAEATQAPPGRDSG